MAGQFDFVPRDHFPLITVDVCGWPAGGRVLVCTLFTNSVLCLVYEMEPDVVCSTVLHIAIFVYTQDGNLTDPKPNL